MLINQEAVPKAPAIDQDSPIQTNPDEATGTKSGFGFIGGAEPSNNSEQEVPESFPMPAPKITVQANATRAAINDLKTYLKGEEYIYEVGLEMGLCKELSPQDVKEIKNYCLYEPLMEQAIAHMKTIESKDYDILKTDSTYRPLFQYPAFQRMVRNSKYYQKKLSIRQSQASSVHGGDSKQAAAPKGKGIAGAYSEEIKTETASSDETKLDLLRNKPLQSVEDQHANLIEARQALLAYEEWLDLMAKCEHLDYPQRCSLLTSQYMKEPMKFIEQLQKYAREEYLPRLFSVLHYITNTLESDGPLKLLLFVSSCAFYELEIMYDDTKDWIKDNSQSVIAKLDNPNMKLQLLGYLQLLFVNDIILPESIAAELTQLLGKYKSVWILFSNWLQTKPYNLRGSIVSRLPMTGMLFTGHFPKLLKQSPTIFNAVPEDFYKHFIDICVFSSEACTETLAAFVKGQGHFVSWYSAPITKAKVIELFNEAAIALKDRSAIWVSKLVLLNQLCTTVIRGVIDKKITNVTTVLGAIRGDTEEMEEQLKSAAHIDKGNPNDLLLLVQRFKHLNAENSNVQAFDMSPYNETTGHLLQDIQSAFNRELHNLQLLCINYVLQSLEKGAAIVRFGIGCGKTLLATTLAILISSLLKKPTIILGKFEYLPYRDHRKFKALIKKCGISTTHNELSKSGISFIDEAKFNELWKSAPTRKQMLGYCLINDEYDWYMFDDIKVSTMQDKLLKLQQFQMFIGFSGSALSLDEGQCIKQAFDTNVAVFPTMKELKGYHPTRFADIVTSTEEDWIAKISERAGEMCKQVPVIIVTSTKKQAASLHKKLKTVGVCTDLAALNCKQKVQQLDIAIEKTFNQPGDAGAYGIYIANEELGRGTDFPTSADIEANGGLFLIAVDVFAARVKSQVDGRVARMQNKGQLQNIVLCSDQGRLNQYIALESQVKDAYHTSTIESLLNQLTIASTATKRPLPRDDIKASFFLSGDYEEIKQENMDLDQASDYEDVGAKVSAFIHGKQDSKAPSVNGSDQDFQHRVNPLQKARLQQQTEDGGVDQSRLRRSIRRRAPIDVEALEKQTQKELGADQAHSEHTLETNVKETSSDQIYSEHIVTVIKEEMIRKKVISEREANEKADKIADEGNWHIKTP